MKWLKRLFGPSAYDQGHQDGFKEGQDWGHEHGACKHSHPLEEAERFLAGPSKPKKKRDFGIRAWWLRDD